MAITRAILETIVIARVGALMHAAGMAVTVEGTNADLDDPFAWATRGVSGITATYSTVTDAELAGVAADRYDDLVVLAVYRTLCNVLGNLDLVDITAGPRSERFSQLARQVRTMIEAMQERVDGIAAQTGMTTGYISLNFAEHGEVPL